MSSDIETFEPGRYLRKVNGSDYLEVKWRLLWLRTAHPNAEIATELISHEGEMAVFKAHVSIPDGGSATGWGSEQFNDFRDYIEKAETKALGRALAALGFGTQFCPDFDFGSAAGHVVDAPINLDARRDQPRDASTSGGSQDFRATEKQRQYLISIARELGIAEEALHTESVASFGRDITTLTRRDASQFIERLQQRKAERGAQASA
jgi:hypothetical protein